MFKKTIANFLMSRQGVFHLQVKLSIQLCGESRKREIELWGGDGNLWDIAAEIFSWSQVEDNKKLGLTFTL